MDEEILSEIALIDGELVMGMAQDVYLAEFDGVQQRTFFIEIIGE